ncbi:hypothetical protein BH24DEI2_BH24DEI2_18380 [soil metagenome]
MSIRFSLDRFLERHDITRYRLAKELEGEVGHTTVYYLARGEEVQRLDLKSLEAVLKGLERLLGERVALESLIEIDAEEEI